MHALAHLLRAHTLFSRRLAVRQDAAQCRPDIGSPGGVYLCGGITDGCQWLAPSKTNVCVPYDVVELGPPALIGPDYGGACTLYTSEDCAEDSEIAFALEVAGAAVRNGGSGILMCPGIGEREVPVGMRSFRCWAVGGEENVLK